MRWNEVERHGERWHGMEAARAEICRAIKCALFVWSILKR